MLAFKKALQTFPFIPKTLYEISVQWLAQDILQVSGDTLTMFMDLIEKFQDAEFPLKWIPKFSLALESRGFNLILTSHGISQLLGPTIYSYSNTLGEEDISALPRRLCRGSARSAYSPAATGRT